ncbi:hypothetical protein ACFL1T_01915 [Chlamydiota bacterium]
MEKKALLVGLGLDAEDGHVRITRGDNFRVYGGSETTHEFLQEKCLRFNEKLKKSGKSLDELNRKEFTVIANEIGLEPFPQKRSLPEDRR